MEKVKKPTIDPHSVSQKLELNFCPRCGRPLEDAWAFGRVRRACPACGLVVFREHKVAAAILVTNHRGEVLLVKRVWAPMQGHWALPAGFVDYDEAPADAAIRECREETGLEPDAVTLLTVITGREHARGADIVLVYQADGINGTPLAQDDAAEARFFALDALPPLAFRATHEALQHWRKIQEAATR